LRPVEVVGYVAAALLVCACRTDDRPARIVDPTDASRAALHDAVVTALQGADVTLADDALTLSSQLIVEPTVHRDAQSGRVMGREVRAPVRFVLLKNREQCVLESVTTRQRWVLAATHCIAE
jgi:hypothetical protein